MNLFIDTHLNDVVIILEKNGKIIRKKEIQNEKENSRIIMPIIKDVIDDDAIDSIIVVNGPGSFTGVRLGVTIAKTLAYTMDIPIRTITSLECIAISTDKSQKIVSLSDKNGHYIGIFDNEYNLIGNYEYLSNKEFDEYKENYDIIHDIPLNYIKIINYTLKKESVNPHRVNPIYVKKLDVEK